MINEGLIYAKARRSPSRAGYVLGKRRGFIYRDVSRTGEQGGLYYKDAPACSRMETRKPNPYPLILLRFKNLYNAIYQAIGIGNSKRKHKTTTTPKEGKKGAAKRWLFIVNNNKQANPLKFPDKIPNF